MATTTARRPRRWLNYKQWTGQACVYCRCTFGVMEPVQAPESCGSLFLFAHPGCRRVAHQATTSTDSTAMG
jgi:hypothetical protein